MHGSVELIFGAIYVLLLMVKLMMKLMMKLMVLPPRPGREQQSSVVSKYEREQCVCGLHCQ